MNMRLISSAALCCACTTTGLLADVVVGSASNFNGSDTQGWTNGFVDDPQVLPGGPGGAGDGYLRVTSDGSGSGGKLTVFNNDPQWTGNWLASGVTHVSMDFFNFDPQGRTLYMRMSFLMAAGPGQPAYCTPAFQVPADGQWHHAVWEISQSALQTAGSPLPYDIAMEGITQVRIFYSVNPSSVGTNFASSVGIDNVTALPAPGAGAALVLLCAGSARRRR